LGDRVGGAGEVLGTPEPVPRGEDPLADLRCTLVALMADIEPAVSTKRYAKLTI